MCGFAATQRLTLESRQSEMRVLIIDKQTQEEISDLRKYAEDPENHRPIPDRSIPGDDPAHVLYVNDFRVVFSVSSGEDGSKFRLMSMSIDKRREPGALPNPEAVKLMAYSFGFTGDFADWMVRPEPDGSPIAILVAQEYNDASPSDVAFDCKAADA